MKILYIEEQARDYQLTKEICDRFPQAEKVVIAHYKNLFDKHIPYAHERCLLLAKQTGNVLLPVPESYGYGSDSYFLRTAMNCLFDCEYCYLKGAFRNDIPVLFVNTQEMQDRVRQIIGQEKCDNIWLYPSNWTDLLASESLSHFHRDWLPFFEELEGLQVESRTKSVSISPLLEMSPARVTEIAYSINPQEIISTYEKGTPPLQKRMHAINTLLDAGWRVGLRIMPLIPVLNWKEIYESFFIVLKQQIEVTRCSSIFFGGFLLTKNDYKLMRKKNPQSDLRQMLEKESGGLCRGDEQVRTEMYALIRSYFPDAKVSFDDL